MTQPRKRKRRPRISQRPIDKALIDLLAILLVEYRTLVGRIIETLETYDKTDGHNDLVLSGIIAEAKRLEDAGDRAEKGKQVCEA